MQFNLYGLFLIIAFILNSIIIVRETQKYNMRYYETIGLLIFENTGIVLGAKILAMFQNDNKSFITAGFSSYGGLIGAIIFIILFSIIFKEKLEYLLCLCFLPVPLMYSISKIGCVVSGCCYGINYSGTGSIIYHNSSVAPNNVELFPVQLLETIVFFLIFCIGYIYYRKHKFTLKTVSILTGFCAFSKGIIFYLRNESNENYFSSHQIICLALIFLSIVFVCAQKLKNKQLNSKNSKTL